MSVIQFLMELMFFLITRYGSQIATPILTKTLGRLEVPRYTADQELMAKPIYLHLGLQFMAVSGTNSDGQNKK